MPHMPQPTLPPRWQRPQVPGQNQLREVRIPVGSQWLHGDLVLPAQMHGLVLFAHGSGSGRHSSRNRLVAAALHQAGVGTLLLDLLTSQEEQADMHTGEHRFNMALLTDRILASTLWVLQQPGLWEWPLGYFGASTGSAAARSTRGASRAPAPSTASASPWSWAMRASTARPAASEPA